MPICLRKMPLQDRFNNITEKHFMGIITSLEFKRIYMQRVDDPGSSDDPFEIYEQEKKTEHPLVYNLCSNINAILAVFGKFNIPNPYLLEDFSNGAYIYSSSFEFGVEMQTPDDVRNSEITTELKKILKTQSIVVRDVPDVDAAISLSFYKDDPLQLSAEIQHRRSLHIKHLEEEAAEQQVVRVFVLNETLPDKLAEVKMKMRDNYQHGPEIRVFADQESYYALEGSHRLRASFELVQETGDTVFNPTLVTYGAEEDVPHDIVNLAGSINKVREIIEIYNSNIYFDFKGDITILGNHDP